jgi:hypothetical protein
VKKLCKYSETILTWETFVSGKHLYLAWEPFVPENLLYLGTICICELFVPGSHLFLGTFWYRNFIARSLFQELYFQERFGGNVLVGTFWQELWVRSPIRVHNIYGASHIGEIRSRVID